MSKRSLEAKSLKQVRKIVDRRRRGVKINDGLVTRVTYRCSACGRARSFSKKTGLCRICFRSEIHKGNLPGWTKASW